MTVFFTSDLHLGHAKIIELCNRPFQSVDEMNEAIIERWNNVVQDGDVVWVLGDVAMGKLQDSLPLCQRLNGSKLLVPGNHDRVFSGYSKKGVRELDVLRYEDAGFTIEAETVLMQAEANLPSLVLCHFPMSGDSHTDDRFPEHRPVIDDDQWLIHGHVHNLWKTNGRQINVGVDVWDFTPVSLDEIRRLMISYYEEN